MNVRDLARICYESARVYAMTTGDNHHRRFANLEPAHQDALVEGVQFHLNDPTAGPEKAHEARVEKLKAKGWRWGPVKAEEDKQTPLIALYDDLPMDRRVKYTIFAILACSLAPLLEKPEPTTEPEAQRQVGVGGAAQQGEPDDSSNPNANQPNSSASSEASTSDQSQPEPSSGSGKAESSENSSTDSTSTAEQPTTSEGSASQSDAEPNASTPETSTSSEPTNEPTAEQAA